MKKAKENEEEQKSSRGMASICFLPADVVVEILARLPVKSLIRFKCVCKSWYALIINPNFITKHLQLNKASSNTHKNARFLLKNHISHKPVVSMLFYESPNVSLGAAMPLFDEDLHSVTLYGTCDGIVCVGFTSRLPPGNFDRQMGLWNPATREFRALPSSRVPRPADLLVQWTDIGFGLDFTSKDYKMVEIIEFASRDYPPQVEVYNLSTDTWRKCDTVVPDSARATRPYSVYLNGFCYWWAGDVVDGGRVVLSFDMADEVFHEIPPPDMEGDSYVTLAKINESIALIIDDANNRLYDVWVMNGNGVDKTWTRQSSIVYGSLEILYVLALLDHGEALVKYKYGGHIGLYNPRTRKFNDLQLPESASYGSCQLVFYSESLVSVKRRNELHQQDNSCNIELEGKEGE